MQKFGSNLTFLGNRKLASFKETSGMLLEISVVVHCYLNYLESRTSGDVLDISRVRIHPLILFLVYFNKLDTDCFRFRKME